MKPAKQISFPPFRLDISNQQLFRGEAAIPLRAKTFSVLRCLLEHADRLLTKDELLDAVWPGTSVTDTVLKVCIREIRQALNDDQKDPKFIATVHRTGYRFIGEVRPSRLPLYLTSFVGRERQITELQHTVRKSRLVTLIGSGGSGKTRLAGEVAAQLTDDFEELWWIELASLSDPALVPQVFASVLEVREQPGHAITDTLASHLSRAGRQMIVVDNCEHLISACALLIDKLLRSAPELKILATSRESLGIAGELTYVVPPLSTPHGTPELGFEELTNFEAVRLFAERAASVMPAFSLTPDNGPALMQICNRLDGIPLAIELAAARVRVLSLEQIATRLDDCFRLLSAGSRTDLPRHQTLRATIDWSHDLLSEKERALLRRLSVFAGSFTLAAVEEICADQLIGANEVLDLLAHLVDKSLVVSLDRQSAFEKRYRLLETVRQYAAEQLSITGTAAACMKRHMGFFVDFAEAIEPQINTAARRSRLRQLENEHGNLRAALHYAIQLQSAATALRLCGALIWFWFHAGYRGEGRSWISSSLALPGTPAGTAIYAKALFADGLLAWTMGDNNAGLLRLQESAAIWREVGDEPGLAYALLFLAMEVLGRGDGRQAEHVAQESVALFRADGKDRFGQAVSLANLGIVLGLNRDANAGPVLEESVARCREIGDNWAVALPLRNLGILAFHRGDCERAVGLLCESLAALREERESWFISRSLETLAEVLAMQGHHQRAARLFGAAEALRETIGASILALYRSDYDAAVSELRDQLGRDQLASAWAEGRAMTMDQAVDYALTQTANTKAM
jgi:predicted ATPase/DNA-binding winged helix-turn-helix (wHTH) protein